MKMKKGFKQMVDEAKSRITTLSLEETRSRHGKGDVVFVDLRDVRELEREGIIPGAFIMLAVLALNVLGDGLRDVLDPRAEMR